jgi:hypothetical protein
MSSFHVASSIHLSIPYRQLANTPVPKTLVNAGGKRMSIRELFNFYDDDYSGGLDKLELRKFIIDLEMVKGLSKAGRCTLTPMKAVLEAPAPGFSA